LDSTLVHQLLTLFPFAAAMIHLNTKLFYHRFVMQVN